MGSILVPLAIVLTILFSQYFTFLLVKVFIRKGLLCVHKAWIQDRQIITKRVVKGTQRLNTFI